VKEREREREGMEEGESIKNKKLTYKLAQQTKQRLCEKKGKGDFFCFQKQFLLHKFGN